MNNTYSNLYHTSYIFYFIAWFYKIINNLSSELNIPFVVIKAGTETNRRYIELKHSKSFSLA